MEGRHERGREEEKERGKTRGKRKWEENVEEMNRLRQMEDNAEDGKEEMGGKGRSRNLEIIREERGEDTSGYGEGGWRKGCEDRETRMMIMGGDSEVMSVDCIIIKIR